jgi:hypothetical protein
MSRSSTVAILLFLAVLASVVGLIDAALEGASDHLVLFTIIVLVVSALAVSTFLSNPTVAIRHDIRRWAARRSALTGERVDQIVGRAIDGYRSLLEPPAEVAVGPDHDVAITRTVGPDGEGRDGT